MSNLIATDAQSQEIDSGLVELFQITLPNNTILYLHPGVDSDLTDVRFRDSTSPTTSAITAGNFIIGNSYTIVSGTGFTSIGASNNNASTVFIATGIGSGSGTATQNDNSIRTYEPFPMIIDGLELQADGAAARPSLTIANIGNLFGSQIGDFKNDDLVGCRIVRRQTLKKYLHGESGDATPPVELRKQEYIIDRIASETNIAITFEVAAPFDLENIKLPRRVVVGKYCSWKYQQGGCSWKADGFIRYGDYTHNAYFNIDDSPLLSALPSGSIAHSSSTSYTTSSYVTHSGKNWQCLIAHTNQTPSLSSIYWKEVFIWAEWASGTSYTKNTLVRYGSTGQKTIWKCIQAHTSSATIFPEKKSNYWVREDSCGKTLQSCKCRFGFIPVANSANNEAPKSEKNTAARLPFGSFPGTMKF